ncbi:MAG: ABC transporter ATP-binding protein [Gammaproteobacteria bacterium]|nr:ABC transporter ATP-binding protein [Gammaproteobacteria bacterium]MDH3370431.1 ABC transporter ATP-binding protein [Gammaproteobacteria bacterium]MDH3405431.1 ABC transporter ATP-binding protein [Gammaproteobacteria bacterium]MDH3563192.1 ABC transporter ATP-binding protein [Gammaproteobacteria bacterium]MDH5486836.1 ABC transporter ATP-binding protein [Gammaproteobacteria bacterium]
MSFLETHELEVSYGGIRAVKGINLTVQRNELVCLIGANGAGKTTTLKSLCGMLPPSRGEILFEETLITGRPSHELVRRGISMVPEGRGIFARLTLEENMKIGAYARTDTATIRSDMDRMYDLFPRLAERRHQQAGTLSGGEQQMLAIGRALMSRPKLLLLDEPSMGLAPMLVQKIFETIRRIAEEGMTLLLVEQNAKLALEVSHRGYVMESGNIVLSDSAETLLKDAKIQECYLGG